MVSSKENGVGGSEVVREDMGRQFTEFYNLTMSCKR